MVASLQVYHWRYGLMVSFHELLKIMLIPSLAVAVDWCGRSGYRHSITDLQRFPSFVVD